MSPKYTLNSSFKRFSQRNNIFGRLNWDKSFDEYDVSMYSRIPSILSQNAPGYDRIDFAMALSSWAVYNYFNGAFSWKKLGDTQSVMAEPTLPRYEIKKGNIGSFTTKMKAAVKASGASLVGIAPYDARWTYTRDRQNNPIELPSKMTSVIALAVEMDPLGLGTSPTLISNHATGIGYSRMAFLVSIVAELIRNLGYGAIPCGNDTALSIPIAIDAGLGQLGRNGLLVTREFGSRVRLCKVLTDMPLEHDKPIDFGVTDYCRRCKECAEACEAEAISFDDEPSFRTTCISNNQGILRWAVDVEKCYRFWIENGGDCSTCIVVCPFNLQTGGKRDVRPEEFWEHAEKK
ncbi:MAG: reductive dehalogenase [Promethearchaeota archaeon]